MVVCLLQELHDKYSMKHLPLEPKSDADCKLVKKLSFCPFCLCDGSNDINYMNHIMCGHYSMAYGCGKCLNKVFLSGQQLKIHIKACAAFPKDDTPLSSDWEPLPPGPQESLHCRKCPKKTALDSTKSHKKLHKKSTCQKEDAPKKEKWYKDKQDKQKSKKSCKR